MSAGEEEWLTHGVYFFINGISNSPQGDAAYWAISHSLRGGSKKYPTYAVIKAEIDFKKPLDLRTEADAKRFNRLRDKVLEKLAFFKEVQSHHSDIALLRCFVEDMGFDCVIINFYIKNRLQIKLHLPSRVPNCTVLCVPRDLLPVDMTNFDVVTSGDVVEVELPK